jgi:hypothetical protein
MSKYGWKRSLGKQSIMLTIYSLILVVCHKQAGNGQE